MCSCPLVSEYDNMKKSQLYFAIILFCAVCPLLVGYAWPVAEGTSSIYYGADQQNITKDFGDGRVDVYSEYTDLFVNNMNIYRDNDAINYDLHEDDTNILTPYATTSNVNAIPYYTKAIVSIAATADSSGKYTITNPGAFLNSNRPGSNWYAAVIVKGHWDEMRVGLAEDVARSVIYYKDSGILQFIGDASVYPYFDNGLQIPVANQNIIFSEGTPYASMAIRIYYLMETPDTYVDLSKGLVMPHGQYGHDYTHWYNGYLNNRVDILIETVAGMKGTFVFPWNNSQNYTVFEIGADNDYIYINPDTDHYEFGTLTNNKFVLIRVDTVADTIKFYHLPGMTSFTDPYLSYIRGDPYDTGNYIDLDPFVTFEMCNWDSGYRPDFNYLIRNTSTALTTVSGINWSMVDLRTYDLDNFQVDISLVQYVEKAKDWSSGGVHDYALNLALYENGSLGPDYTSLMWVTSDYMLHFTDVDGVEHEIPVGDASMQFIDRSVYVNGIRIIDAHFYCPHIELFFYGAWLAQVYLYDLNEETYPTYSWSPGGFGLDIDGYCLVGLMTSVLAGVGCMLAGRRSGSSAIVELFIAMMCGGTYLVILINGL